METMFMQNFGGKAKSIMVFLKVAYDSHLFLSNCSGNEEQSGSCARLGEEN